MTALLSSQAILTGPVSSALCGHAAPRVLKRGQKKAVITTCLSEYSGPPPAWPGRAVIKEHSDKVKLPKVSIIGLEVGNICIHYETTHTSICMCRNSLCSGPPAVLAPSPEIIEEHPEQFELVALGAGSNIELLADQIRQFQPSLVSLNDGSKVQQLKELIKDVKKQ